jgi:hypothetical protein
MGMEDGKGNACCFVRGYKIAFIITNFIVVIVNEITTINNAQWFSIHLYVVQKWKKILILFYDAFSSSLIDSR